MSEEQVYIQIQQDLESWTTQSEQGDCLGMLDTLTIMKAEIDKLSPTFSFVRSIFALCCYDTCAIAVNGGLQQRLGRRLEQCFAWVLEYANKALAADSLDFRGQFIKTVVASDDLGANNVGLGDLVSNTMREQGSFMKSFRFAHDLTASTAAKRSYLTELDKLVYVYTEGFKAYATDFEEFIYRTQQMMLFVDFSERQKVGDPKKVLQAILSVDTNRLEYSQDLGPANISQAKNQVNTAVRLAQARLQNMR